MGNKRVQVWEVIYPIFAYLVVFNIAAYCIQSIFHITQSNYMMMQSAVELVCIPVVIYFYRRTIPITRRPEQFKSRALAGILAGVCFSVALNNLIALTPLKEMSGQFQEVNALFYGGFLFFEILAAGILAPILEEVLYRGVIQGRIRAVWGSKTAILASSLIFGLLHFNLVQFIYGTLLGLVFALIVEATRDVKTAVFCHMAANLVAIFTTETNIAGWVFRHSVPNLILSAVLLAAGGMLLYKCVKGKIR